jgi:hypothetical protein
MKPSSAGTLLRETKDALSGEWTHGSSSLIYRRGGLNFIQCISYQVSRSDQKVVFSCFVQVLSRPCDTFSVHFGGRLKTLNGRDWWLAPEIDLDVNEFLSVLRPQAALSLEATLDERSLRESLTSRGMAATDYNHAWCSALVLGLNGDVRLAERSAMTASKELEKLRRGWSRSGMAKVQWAEEAVAELRVIQELLPNPAQFRAYCDRHSIETAKKLGLADR